MKRKTDFITNSSSCSFIVWGITLDEETLKKKYSRALFTLFKEREAKEIEFEAHKKLGPALFNSFKVEDLDSSKPSTTKAKEVAFNEEEYQQYLDEDFMYNIDSWIGNYLEARMMPYESEIMIGVSPFSIGNDQTLTQFKEEIVQQFHKAGFEDITVGDLDQIEECWMDN